MRVDHYPDGEGCAALETFQGSRTPETDPKARGALYGLTLKHGRGHVWRALLEATALGTRASVDALTQGSEAKQDLALSGGATRSKLWLQMHADACGRDVVVCVAIKFHLRDGVKANSTQVIIGES